MVFQRVDAGKGIATVPREIALASLRTRIDVKPPLILIALLSVATSAQAELGSLFPGAQTAKPLVSTPAVAVSRGDASLFSGASDGSFFAPLPERPQQAHTPQSRAVGGPAAQIRHLIAVAEAGSKGYDAVQYGAKRKTPKPPTQMTIAEINAWVKATPGQPHAIGRYQFIPPTFRRLVALLRIDEDELFSPRVQDMMADRLLFEAGLQKAEKGEISRITLMNNLAKIWAGLPNSTGRSHYHGYAGNKATMSWSRFDAEMRRIFKESS